MLANTKILGLCVTKIHDKVRADFVDKLNKQANAAGYKLVCFNSIEDFYTDDVYNKGAGSVYNRIDYNIVDGLIICAEHFCDGRVIDWLVSRARSNQVPVVIVDGEREGCISVLNDGEEAFKGLMRHIIREHHVTDTFFIAGRKENDINSVRRLQFYKEVLQEEGLTFCENKVAYGEYWDGPAMRIAEELAEKEELPQAIFCANDSMAFGVCRMLKSLGYRVPEDVIVSGFDGIPAVDYFYPILSTCREDRDGLAEKCIDAFRQIFAGSQPNAKIRSPYAICLNESCGCKKTSLVERNDDAARLYQLIEEVESHDNYSAREVNVMLNIQDMEELYFPMSKFILQGSWMCINSQFLQLADEETYESGATVAVPCMYDVREGRRTISDDDMVPETDKWLNEKSSYVITAVCSKDMPCGYFAVKTDDISRVNFKIIRIVRQANLVFNALINQFRQRKMMRDIENAGYMDAMTGLPNLKGATRWFGDFSKSEKNHQKTLAVSIYTFPQYTYIFENYGVDEIEKVSKLIAEKLKQVNRKDCFLAKLSNNEFMVLNYFNDGNDVGDTINHATGTFFPAMDEYNRTNGKEYFLEVNAGCTIADAGWTSSLETLIRFASAEVFLNRLKLGTADTVKKSITHEEYYSVFSLLVDNNLFTYHMQPIVDAKTGEIYAYEALMRTTGGINLSPLDVLDMAEEFKRLGDIEHATLFNVIQRYATEFEKFKGRRVFINTIPNHFLSGEECDELIEQYGQYLDYFVYEVTEQGSSSDEEICSIKRLCGESGIVQIAIDDYGTGHSNIVNLLRYSPQIIKIDRYLISGIADDENKQMFVKNTIEFAAMNHIKVLAEGVETAEELRMVIGFGVDLIQGYYTARPAAEPIEAIAEEIKNEIIDENLRRSRYDNDKKKIYTAENGETVNLVSLVLGKYNYVNVVSGEVTLIGKKDSTLNIIIRVADNADVKIKLVEANLQGTDESAIQLGKGSNVELEIVGYNTINKSGILVTKKAKLRLTGKGSLLINCNQSEGIGIGARYDDSYGEIIFDHTGRVKVLSSGDRLVSVGGGYTYSSIRVKRGKLEIVGSGISVVGMGSTRGEADIRIDKEAEVTIKESGNESLGIGTIDGVLKFVSGGQVNVTADGEKAVALGCFAGKGGTIDLEGGCVQGVVHCDSGVVLGSYSGKVSTVCGDCRLTVYGEGSFVTGIGSNSGDCVTEFNSGISDVKVVSANAQPFGNENDRIIISGGNVICLNEDTEVCAKNAYGQKLHQVLCDEMQFEKVVKASGGEYVYSAKRCEKYDVLSVYLP